MIQDNVGRSQAFGSDYFVAGQVSGCRSASAAITAVLCRRMWHGGVYTECSALPSLLEGCLPDSRICGCLQKWRICAMHVQAIEENHHQADVSLQQQDDNFFVA